jgi:hypothetical protein
MTSLSAYMIVVAELEGCNADILTLYKLQFLATPAARSGRNAVRGRRRRRRRISSNRK